MLGVTSYERFGKAQRVLLVKRIANILHVPVVGVLRVAIHIRDIDGGMLMMQPKGCRTHSNIQNNFDPGRLQLINNAWLVCTEEGCNRKYPIREDIPIMLIEEGDKYRNTPVEELGQP